MSRKEILRSGLFLLLLLALILSAWAVLDRKLACHYTKAVHGFFNEEPESMDVIFVGSSHAYCSANPMALWDETGLSSYVLSTQSQPLQASYHYLQQCFTPSRPANCFRLSYEGVTPRALSAEGREQLLRIRELVESNGAELMLFIAPYEGADKDNGAL